MSQATKMKSSVIAAEDETKEFKQLQQVNLVLVQQLNTLLDQLTSDSIDEVVLSISTVQGIKFLVDGHLLVTDLKGG